MKRLHAVDIVRGLVMVIMALDHTRDLIHVHGFDQSPTDFTTTTIPLFFTRWVTHICAPTFLFLTGVSSFLSLQRRNDVKRARQFYFTRGLWLIILEFTLINFALWFDIHFSVWIFNILGAIGAAYLLLGLLLPLGARTIGWIGLVIILFHNLLLLVPQDNDVLQPLRFLFFSGAVPLPGNGLFIIGYGPLPWAALLFVGYAAGKWFSGETQDRKKRWLLYGTASVAFFLLLRAINVYGDPLPWSKQPQEGFTLLSFLNVNKYPPSLQYVSLFLGMMFLLLWAVEGRNNGFTRWLTVYGKVPLFYFILHWYLIRIFLFAMVFAQGFGVKDMVFGFSFGRPKTGSGLELWGVYLVWAAVVLLMYPLCKWYGTYKSNHPEKKWLQYL